VKDPVIFVARPAATSTITSVRMPMGSHLPGATSGTIMNLL